jgi:hypothetical protein
MPYAPLLSTNRERVWFLASVVIGAGSIALYLGGIIPVLALAGCAFVFGLMTFSLGFYLRPKAKRRQADRKSI